MLTSSGFAMNVHYCMGKVSSWNIDFVSSVKKCPCGSKKKKSACCKTETKVVKLVNNYQTANVHYIIETPQKALINNFQDTTVFVSENYTSLNKTIKSSPHLRNSNSVSPCIKYCVFRI
ncbi:MAG: HYC_CC_PP family protein, partial [Chitinophagaceae bacterium]